MKFMKLGSKPDQFQTEGDNIRYIATELATDVVVNVADVKFYLHKFPLLSKSARLQKQVDCFNGDNSDEVVDMHDIPGGPAAFEICAKFCYGMIVTLNAYNVVAARCAAEYLEMYETVDKGNLIYKIEVFLSSSIFRSWKDSIIVLQTTRSLLPWSEELMMVSHSLESIASKASVDPSKVEWSYTYNRKKLPSENGIDPHYNGVNKHQLVPKDWWVEDLCELQIDLYKRVITTIKSKGRVPADVVGEALQAYTLKRLPSSSNSMIQSGDLAKYRYLVDSITWLLPPEKNSVPCSFLLRLLKASIALESEETVRNELLRRVGRLLEEAVVTDLLIKASATSEATIYNIDIVRDLVEQFIMQERNPKMECHDGFREICPEFVSDASKAKVARVIDMYLAEAARDPNLPLSKFMELAEMTSGFFRQSHDGVYRAIDMYLKEHPGISKSDRKRLCRPMDCTKLSAEACSHAVQNERLPLRVVVQLLFFEQMRTTVSKGNGTPDLPRSIITMLPGGSHGSSRSAATHTDEELDAVPTTEELKALKVELATLRLRNGGNKVMATDAETDTEKLAASKVKGAALSKLFSRLWSNKDSRSQNSSCETSESAASTSGDDTKSTPSRSRRASSS